MKSPAQKTWCPRSLRAFRTALLMLLFSSCALAMFFVLAPLPVSSQEPAGQSAAQESSVQDDAADAAAREHWQDESAQETYFFAFLAEDPQPLRGGLLEYFRNKPVARDFITPHDPLDRRFRPMLQWRRWADRRQRFVPALLFISFVSILGWSLIPGTMQSAAEESRNTFWRSFGTGVLLAAVTMILTRAVFHTQLGWPLGILLAGLSQAAMLAGLSIAVYNIGHSVLLILQVRKLSVFSKNPAAFRICELLTGSLMAALLLQIPPLGAIPQVGTRFLALFALLGVGAIFRILKQRASVSG